MVQRFKAQPHGNEGRWLLINLFKEGIWCHILHSEYIIRAVYESGRSCETRPQDSIFFLLIPALSL